MGFQKFFLFLIPTINQNACIAKLEMASCFIFIFLQVHCARVCSIIFQCMVPLTNNVMKVGDIHLSWHVAHGSRQAGLQERKIWHTNEFTRRYYALHENNIADQSSMSDLLVYRRNRRETIYYRRKVVYIKNLQEA